MKAALPLLLLADADAIVSSRKVLLLHGSGSSAGAFLNRGAMGIQGAASASYHDGGRLAWLFGAMDWDVGFEDDLEWGEWWTRPAEEASPAGFAAAEKAIDNIMAKVRDEEYDGIVGFSEGAMIAAVIAARAVLDPDFRGPMSFAVMCGGAVPAPYEDLLARARDDPSAAMLPTVHCLSQLDTVRGPEQGERLAAFFGPEALIAWHEAGHAMPSAAECKPIITFLDEAAPTPYTRNAGGGRMGGGIGMRAR